MDLIKKLFKNNLLFELQRINDSNIDSFEDYLIEKSYKFNIPLIGTNNIKFGEVDEFSAHDALLCVAQKTTINSGNRKTSNNQIAFKSNDQMIDIFFDIPEIVEIILMLQYHVVITQERFCQNYLSLKIILIFQRVIY